MFVCVVHEDDIVVLDIFYCMVATMKILLLLLSCI